MTNIPADPGPSRHREVKRGLPIALAVIAIAVLGGGAAMLAIRDANSRSEQAARDKRFKSVASVPSTTRPGAPKVTVELSDEPAAEPVERLLSAFDGKFNPVLFASAFDIGEQQQNCDVSGELAKLKDSPPDEVPPLSESDVVFTAKVVKKDASTAEVTVLSDGEASGPVFNVTKGEERWVVDSISLPDMPPEFVGHACDALALFVGATSRMDDRVVQSDLRNALTAEKTWYTDTQEYTSDVAKLKEIESSLDWGGELTVMVGDVEDVDNYDDGGFGGYDNGVVCLEETSENGDTFAIGDVAAGPNAGTYFGTKCPAQPLAEDVANIGTSWDE